MDPAVLNPRLDTTNSNDNDFNVVIPPIGPFETTEVWANLFDTAEPMSKSKIGRFGLLMQVQPIQEKGTALLLLRYQSTHNTVLN
ncbi:MAG: hypothetical protein CM15mP3_06640 [Candidatus Poseidoniales archaeon]|nr:MAG: hypothetical protein CM15mP3_06640 [Candidatus Poseidoniales archaeon]